MALPISTTGCYRVTRDLETEDYVIGKDCALIGNVPLALDANDMVRCWSIGSGTPLLVPADALEKLP